MSITFKTSIFLITKIIINLFRSQLFDNYLYRVHLVKSIIIYGYYIFNLFIVYWVGCTVLVGSLGSTIFYVTLNFKVVILSYFK